MKKTPPPPTTEQSAAYQRMFAYFNRRLFAGSLPPVILNFSRHASAYGFFAPERWTHDGDAKRVTHEISLNPVHMRTRPPREVAATLVHEMVHLWQQVHGKPSRTGYHNHEWAAEMERVGLVPSSTGEPGGAKVGQKVSHYIAPGGAFELAWDALPDECALPWHGVPEGAGEKGKAKSRNKVKYTCPTCSANVWGKPGLNVVCGDDSARFLAPDDDGDDDGDETGAVDGCTVVTGPCETP